MFRAAWEWVGDVWFFARVHAVGMWRFGPRDYWRMRRELDALMTAVLKAKE